MSGATSRPLAVAVSGSPRSPSRSKRLAEQLLELLAARGCTIGLIDLTTLPADALLARSPSSEVDGAIAAVGEARIVIAATPTYRALYTGLLKCFFDLMPPGHLRRKLCLPVQTGASPIHYLAMEYGLRPLFMSLDGIPLAGVYATDDEFTDGEPSMELRERLVVVAGEAVGLTGQQ